MPKLTKNRRLVLRVVPNLVTFLNRVSDDRGEVRSDTARKALIEGLRVLDKQDAEHRYLWDAPKPGRQA